MKHRSQRFPLHRRSWQLHAWSTSVHTCRIIWRKWLTVYKCYLSISLGGVRTNVKCQAGYLAVWARVEPRISKPRSADHNAMASVKNSWRKLKCTSLGVVHPNSLLIYSVCWKTLISSQKSSKMLFYQNQSQGYLKENNKIMLAYCKRKNCSL